MSLICWHNIENNRSQFWWDFHESYIQALCKGRYIGLELTCNVNLLVTLHSYTCMCIFMTLMIVNHKFSYTWKR